MLKNNMQDTDFFDTSRWHVQHTNTSLRQLWRAYFQQRYAALEKKLQLDQALRHPHEIACAGEVPQARWQKLGDAQSHLAHSIALFEQGAFIVLVDEQRILHVDDIFSLAMHSQIQMIRLFALTGKIKK